MGKTLVIVESPTKAKTIARFLPKGFVVESSVGHIRDLPTSAKEVPEKFKKTPWARLGIDIDDDFKPLYVIPAEKKKVVTRLKTVLKEASALYLATDEDREGESISWHLCEVLNPRVPRRRLVFHEITREAIQQALQNPRDVDMKLVQAQETRRLVDRLYGYEISPVLWKKIAPRLSAGRVQSVAVRIVVDRERERQRFVVSSYWDLSASFRPLVPEAPAEGAPATFTAVLVELGGKRVASGKDFDSTTGRLKDETKGAILLGAEEARALTERLRSSSWRTARVEQKPYATRPSPPFTTSTLQQEANRKFRLSTRTTMQAAQRLYENGHITYMRTDSVTLSEQAIQRIRELVAERYGREYLTSEPRRYKTSVKNAQEAHEAIRPSAEFHRPEEIRGELSEVEFKVYELIWKRTVACQMEDARGQRIVVALSDGEAVFQASGKTIEFPGFLRAYVEGADDPDAELADRETLLPPLAEGDPVELTAIEPKEHSTQPPPRFTEASLVKELEANGVGRPSTYASIIDVIQRRDYVVKEGNSLVPTFIAFAVVQFLERHFSDLVDVRFTARMEDDLDEISLGRQESLPYLKSFYHGTRGSHGLKGLLGQEIDPRESCTLRLGEDGAGRTINIRVGRYGPYLERGDERATIPQGLAPDELTIAKAEEILEKGAAGPQSLGKDPESGKSIYVKIGRFGPYVQLGENDEMPKMKSLLPGMDPAAMSIEAALKLLSLPRLVGKVPAESGLAVAGEDVFADFGRYGPYIKCGRETRSLAEGDDVFSLPLERAVALLSQEKGKGGWRARLQPKVLKELGPRPHDQAPVRLLAGRYGPYVTDGEVNASLPRGRNPDEVTLAEALELLAQRAAAGPPARRRGRSSKSPAKVRARKSDDGPDGGPNDGSAAAEASAARSAARGAKRSVVRASGGGGRGARRTR